MLTHSPPLVKWAALALMLWLASCSSVPMTRVESANQNSRIDHIVIHATSEDFAESMRLLTTRTATPVSAHYLIPAPNDSSYPRDSLRVYSLVPDHRRAWHAGLSFWAGDVALNDSSIGIELVNEFECTGTDVPVDEILLDEIDCEFLPYSEEQLQLLVDLLQLLLERYPGIDPIDIVGHSDIAIARRSDPGPLFPWQQLSEAGIGAWPEVEVTARYLEEFAEDMPPVDKIQAALLALGYQVEVSGEVDMQTQLALRAFQLHFRPANASGGLDAESVAMLWALLEKYRASELAEIESIEPLLPSIETAQ